MEVLLTMPSKFIVNFTQTLPVCIQERKARLVITADISLLLRSLFLATKQDHVEPRF